MGVKKRSVKKKIVSNTNSEEKQRSAVQYIKGMQLHEKILLMTSCIVVVLLCRYIFTAGNTYMQSDAASTILLAKEMIKSKQLFPDTYHYGSGISLVSYPICLFLLLGAGYLLAHNFAQLLFAGLMLISIIMLSKKMFHNNSWLLMVPILFTDVSTPRYAHFFIESGYAVYVIIMFFSLTCFTSVSDTDSSMSVKKRRSLRFLLYSAFAVMTGIVFLQQVTLPLCGAVLICEFINNTPQRFRDIKKQINYVLMILGMSLAGCVLYKLICNQIHIGGNPGLTTFRSSYSEIIENIPTTVHSILYSMGFNGSASLFSFRGIVNLVRIVLTAFIWLIFPFLSFKNLKNERRNVQLFLVFSIIHIAELYIMLLFCNSGNFIAKARYQLTALVLLTVISCNYVYEHFMKKDNLIRWIYSMSLIMVSLILAIPSANISGWQDKLAGMQGITNYLEENELYYGYASYWNSEKNTALSDGHVQINPVYVRTNSVAPFLSLSADDWYEPDNYEGRTFLMLTDSEIDSFAPDGFENTSLSIPETVLNYPPYTILVYDHNISQNSFQALLPEETN